MANKRVIELNERTQIDMNDWLLVDSSTSTRKLSIATLLSYFTYYSLIFVEELPTQDIQPNVVYLVPHSGSNTQWDEYIYINNDWSLIGVSTIDLSSIYQRITDNNLQTTSKQIVGAINEVNTALTKHTAGTSVNITSYTSDFYTCPSDGYLKAITAATSNDRIVVAVRDFGNILIAGGTDNSVNSLFVRKGMQAKVAHSNGTVELDFIPLN